MKERNDAESQARLVEENIRLAYYFAARAQRRGALIEPDELLSLSMRGLFAASRVYDENKGVRFSTFASRIITNEIAQELRARRGPKRAYLRDARSLDAPLGAGALSLGEALPDGSGDVGAYVAARVDITRALRRLSPRARAMLIMASMGYPQREIAARMGVTQSACSKMIACAQSRLRALVTNGANA